MRLLGSAAALLLVASISADPVLEPWNKAIRDHVVANNLGSSVRSINQLFRLRLRLRLPKSSWLGPRRGRIHRGSHTLMGHVHTDHDIP